MNIEKFLQKRGFAKNKYQANIIMISIIIFCIIIMYFILKPSKKNKPLNLSNEELKIIDNSLIK